DEVRGLLAGDVCVALADGNTPVLWGADVIVPQGLLGVWRVLRGVAEARANSRRATHLAMAGAVIGGLQLISGGTRGARRPPVPGWPRPDPVTVAGLTGIGMGWWSALRAGLARPPAPRVRTAWHELTSDEVVALLRQTPD